MATLLSLNVGMPKDVSWRGRTVHTGVWKTPVEGPRMVRRPTSTATGRATRRARRGARRPGYQVESYRHWGGVPRTRHLERGAFGENFTVEGLADDEVCIGDRWRIGEAEFEVSQPRVTCFRVGMRMGEPRLPSLLVAHHRPGFYLRVLTEGHVSAGDEIVRTARGPNAVTVAEVDALLYLPGHDRERRGAALDIPALSPGWRGSFRSMLDGGGHQPARSRSPRRRPGQGSRSLSPGVVVRRHRDVVPDERGRALPAYLPGQFLTLRVPGAGDPVPVRTYSLSATPPAGRTGSA
jgi:MOSC domain-containing protein YiiM